MRLRFKVANLRSENLGNALAAKVQSLAQAGGAKVRASTKPAFESLLRILGQPGHPRVPDQAEATLRSFESLDNLIATLNSKRNVHENHGKPYIKPLFQMGYPGWCRTDPDLTAA